MKKFLSLTLALVMLLSFAACGEGDSSDSESNNKKKKANPTLVEYFEEHKDDYDNISYEVEGNGVIITAVNDEFEKSYDNYNVSAEALEEIKEKSITEEAGIFLARYQKDVPELEYVTIIITDSEGTVLGTGTSTEPHKFVSASKTEEEDGAEISKSSYTLVAEGTLTMATNAAFPPYEMIDENGNFTGIDIDIAKAVAEKMGLKLEVCDMAFSSLIDSVNSGKVDVVLAGMTVTEDRKKLVSFSDSYTTNTQVVIVKAGSSITSITDLEGKKIGVQTGTIGDIYCAGDYGEEAVSRYPNGALAVQALSNGQVDCVVIDNEAAKALVSANNGLKILETEFVVEDYVAAFAKGNDELLTAFNKALAELKADGTVDAIVEKYIKTE